MTKYCKVTVAFSALFLSAFLCASAANTSPKVVFIGDQFTYGWTSAFAANPNWINQGWQNTNVLPGCADLCEGGTSGATLARFQADVINLHPAIVHIMVGVDDADVDDDESYPYAYGSFLTSLEAMVKMAQAANIQVVLGIESPQWSDLAPLEPINSIIANYGAEKNIPVINYADALCGCVGSTGGVGVGFNFLTPNAPYMVPTNVSGAYTPSAAGYALMTQMAEAVINPLGETVQGGYLQTVQQANPNVDGNVPVVNGNTVSGGAVLQFTPYGYYRNGLLEPFINSNYAGATGTWASSNPLVMYVSQTGLSTALSQGTAIITYRSPTGVKFNEWIMYVVMP
jgi:GDSL-like Lipase/Acylhydrolase family